MATKYRGMNGRYIEVDLSSGGSRTIELTDSDVELYLGCKVLASKFLHEMIPPGTNAYDPGNVVIVNTGPLTGSGAPTSARFNISSKSPLTGGAGASNCGGSFGIYLKKTGHDGLIIKGKAERPVWLEISEKGAEINDASEMWGLNTEETEEALGGGRKTGKLVIGPAGENLVRYAAVMSGERAAGRTGLGAVFGSKNLKAVTAKGTKRLRPADPEAFRKAVSSWTRLLRKHNITGSLLPKYGTSNIMRTVSDGNALPVKNFQQGAFEGAENISGQTLAEKYLVKNYGCMSCPIHCGRYIEYKGERFKGPEFETLGMLGANLGNSNLESIIEWNRLLDRLGMDTISTGAALGFVMELTEQGLLESTLEFGKIDNVAQAIENIAYRKGLGHDMAEGVKKMAKKYGGEEFAMHAKGLEFAAYEPRGAVGHGLGYATANRGGCHLDGGYLVFYEVTNDMTMDPLSPKSKPAFCVFNQNAFEAVSAAGTCIFTTYAVMPNLISSLSKIPGIPLIFKEVTKYAGLLLDRQGAFPEWALPLHLPGLNHTEALSAYTGMKMNLGRFLKIGERGFNLERMFNIKHGLLPREDRLPERTTHVLQRLNEPRSKVPLAKMLKSYYKIRGWDERGMPAKRKLQSLNIDWTMEEVDFG